MRKQLLTIVCASLATVIFAQPVITSFTPVTGAVGTTVTINGTGFSATASNNIVYFGTVKATVSVATTTSIAVTVPAGSTCQPITVTTNNLTAYSGNSFIPSFGNTGLSFTASSFLPKVDITCGMYPHSVTLADFDNDGKPDMLVSRGSSAVVSVFRNTSSVATLSFATQADFATTGNNHEGAAIADFDGDGKLDFVITNSNNLNSVSVYKNTSVTGGISFSANIDLAVDNAPYAVAAGDLDGDGKPDLAIANNGSDKVTIYRNTSTPGNISFDSRTDLPGGTAPFGIAIGDLNNDGKPELAITTQSATSSVAVMKNTSTSGTISFDPYSIIATFAGPFTVSIADLDGDNKPDMAAASAGTGAIVVRNTSTGGTISFAPAQTFTTHNYPVCIAIGDIDGDGKPDMVSCNRFSNDVSVLRNTSATGSIAFETNVDYAVNADPIYVAAGDLDGDGKADIIAANSSSTDVSILRNMVNVPDITSVSTGTANTGTAVTINGNRFTGATAVKFGGTPAASFTVVSPTRIDAVVGGGASGEITVTTGSGTASIGGFSFIPQITTDGVATFCNHESIILTSTASANNQWYKDGSIITGATATTLQVTTSGVYTVKTTSNGITTASPDGITATAIIVPVPVITMNASNDLVSSAATGNQWYFNGTAITGAINQTYHPTQTGNYTVTATPGSCTSDQSVNFAYTVTGVINLGNDQFIKFYPNPVVKQLNISWNINGASSLNIMIIDLQGRQILAKKNIHTGASIDLSSLPAGVYFVKINNDQLKINETIKISR